jgi:hypothetical protein
MQRTDEEKLKASITVALDEWWANDVAGTGVNLPYVGGDTLQQMAAAALSVLLGIADVQETMIRDGLIQADAL